MPHPHRRRLRLATLTLSALAGCLLHDVPVQAREAAFAERRGEMSLDEAVAIAERRYRARVVRHGTDESGGQRYFVLRLLSEQGRVWTVRVDPRTGAMTQVP